MRFLQLVLLSSVAVAGFAGSGLAADLVVDAPAAPVAAPSDTRGVVEVGALASYVHQTDDDYYGLAGGAYASAAAWGMAESMIWGVDGYIDANSFGDEQAPNFVGVVGGHLAFGTETGLFGGFASFGLTPDNDHEVQMGLTAGIEGMTTMDNIALFGQLGYANIRTDGTDSGFTGPFARVGMVYALDDSMAVMVDAAYGHSIDFEDNGDDGDMATIGVKAAFAAPTDFTSYMTVSYEFGYWQANTEDFAQSHVIKVGLSIPFGTETAAEALNPLATPVLPYRGAAWGEELD